MFNNPECSYCIGKAPFVDKVLADRLVEVQLACGRVRRTEVGPHILSLLLKALREDSGDRVLAVVEFKPGRPVTARTVTNVADTDEGAPEFWLRPQEVLEVAPENEVACLMAQLRLSIYMEFACC